jgi:virulence factor Mce-like protein
VTRRATSSILASPLLIGAVTVLVIGISVYLGFNANRGLPFIPTYDLYAELPSGANLVVGNEVMLSGFRVGQIVSMTPKTVEESDGSTRSIALLKLKLDKVAQPLAVDSVLNVRTRSALGLKYLEITPGHASDIFHSGDTIPLANSPRVVEFDDFLNTFGDQTREDQRRLITGFGDALAGQGASINEAVGALPRLFGSLTTVMDALNDPSTRLDQLFVQIGAVTREVAPVARTQAILFTNMADTFAAINRDPGALRETIEETPPTLAQATTSFATQRPFLDDLAGLASKLRPAASELPHALPDVNQALAAGRQVLPRTVSLNRDLEGTLRGLDELGRDGNTLEGAKDLRYSFAVLKPLIQYTAPVNTVCNFGTYFFTRLGEHISQQVDGGTAERIEVSLDNFTQPNRLGSTENSRPADVAKGLGVYDEHAYPLGPATRPSQLFYGTKSPAGGVTKNGKANCQEANRGYLTGPVEDGARYTANDDGGRHVVFNDGMPFVSGPTFTGVPSLRKVDSGAKYSLRKAP